MHAGFLNGLIPSRSRATVAPFVFQCITVGIKRLRGADRHFQRRLTGRDIRHQHRLRSAITAAVNDARDAAVGVFPPFVAVLDDV